MTAQRKTFAATYFCGHTRWSSLPDGPGFTAEKARFQAAAAKNNCPDCVRRNAREPAGSYTDRW
jgi:hypothetical protein